MAAAITYMLYAILPPSYQTLNQPKIHRLLANTMLFT